MNKHLMLALGYACGFGICTVAATEFAQRAVVSYRRSQLLARMADQQLTWAEQQAAQAARDAA